MRGNFGSGLRMALMSTALMYPALAAAQTGPETGSSSAANANQAEASTGSPDQPSPQAKADVQPDIVVTATRRETTLQRTPISITAVSGDTLRQQGATNLQDYFRTIPNVNVTQGPIGSSRISFRGIVSAGEATVGLFYDDTPVTGPAGTTQDPGNNAVDLNLFDVKRVEVLRGPQGTLFGSGSLGGTLRILFNQPNATRFEASTEVQASSVKGGGDGVFVKGMANIPIVKDRMALRISGYGERRPGYIDNVRYGTTDINRSRNSGLRALLAFTPDDNFSLTFTAIYQDAAAPDAQGWYERLGRDKTDSPIRQIFDNSFQLYSGTIRWRAPIGDFTSNTALYSYDITRSFDSGPAISQLSRVPSLCSVFIRAARACTAAELSRYAAYGQSRLPAGGYQPLNLNTFTHESRFSSRGDGPIQYTVGLFYEDRTDGVDSRIVKAGPDGTLIPNDITSERTVGTHTKQFSQFGELSYKLLPELTVTGGLRHYEYTKTTDGTVVLASPLTGLLPAAPSSVSVKASGWIKKVNLAWQATPALLGYATYSEGFRPGGANNVANLPAAFTVYGADTLRNYEVGVKASLLANRLTLSGDLFRADWTNLQTGATTANGLFAFIINAGAARIQGGEFEAAYRPTDTLRLSVGYGHSDARLTADQVATGVTTTGSTGLAGDRLPGVPRDTLSGSLAWTVPLSDSLAGLVRVDGAYTGPQYSAFRGPNQERFGDFTSANARIGLRSGQTEVSLFVQNVTDTVGLVTAYSTLGVKRQVFSIPPRTVGINLAAHF